MQRKKHEIKCNGIRMPEGRASDSRPPVESNGTLSSEGWPPGSAVRPVRIERAGAILGRPTESMDWGTRPLLWQHLDQQFGNSQQFWSTDLQHLHFPDKHRP
jgi:hypothetical protein